MRTLATLGIVSALLFGAGVFGASAPASAQTNPYAGDPGYDVQDDIGPGGEVGPDGELLPDEGYDVTPGYEPPVVYGAPPIYRGPPIYRPFGGEGGYVYRRAPGAFGTDGRDRVPDARRRFDRGFGDNGQRGGMRPDGQDPRQRQYGERRAPEGQFQGGRGEGEGRGQRRLRPEAGGEGER